MSRGVPSAGYNLPSQKECQTSIRPGPHKRVRLRSIAVWCTRPLLSLVAQRTHTPTTTNERSELVRLTAVERGVVGIRFCGLASIYVTTDDKSAK